MAVFALRAEARRVHVIGLVTAVAVLRNLVFVIAAAVAGDAVDLVMHAEQFVFRLLEVIELGGLPFLRHMALGAILAARSAVLVVGGVASITCLGRLLIASADVAGIAGHGRVSARELEVRLVVIEFPSGPAQGTVALAA